MIHLGAYAEIVSKSFKSRIVFRSRTLFAIANSLVVIIVNVSVWYSLYLGGVGKSSVSFDTMVTNLVIGIGLSSAFAMDDNYSASRIRSGDIAVDLLKPIGYLGQLVAIEIGRTLQRLLVEFLPALIFCICVFIVLPPDSVVSAALFVISILLGWVLLFQLSSSISLIAFWYFNIWSFTTFKNALILVLSGAYLPSWYFPGWVQGIASLTPFPSIISTPLTIYFGRYHGLGEATVLIGSQIVWAMILAAVVLGLWKVGLRKISVLGG